MFDAFAKAQADGELAAAELATTATNWGEQQAALDRLAHGLAPSAELLATYARGEASRLD